MKAKGRIHLDMFSVNSITFFKIQNKFRNQYDSDGKSCKT